MTPRFASPRPSKCVELRMMLSNTPVPRELRYNSKYKRLRRTTRALVHADKSESILNSIPALLDHSMRLTLIEHHLQPKSADFFHTGQAFAV